MRQVSPMWTSIPYVQGFDERERETLSIIEYSFVLYSHLRTKVPLKHSEERVINKKLSHLI